MAIQLNLGRVSAHAINMLAIIAMARDLHRRALTVEQKRVHRGNAHHAIRRLRIEIEYARRAAERHRSAA
jgi:hypothetical protein